MLGKEKRAAGEDISLLKLGSVVGVAEAAAMAMAEEGSRNAAELIAQDNAAPAPSTARANLSNIMPGWFSEISPMWPGACLLFSSFFSLSLATLLFVWFVFLRFRSQQQYLVCVSVREVLVRFISLSFMEVH